MLVRYVTWFQRARGLCASVALSLVPLVLAFASAGLAQTVVSSCGLAYSGTGHLASDLDCSAHVGDAVTIANGSLDLRGFTLTGNVRCIADCAVHSTGTRGRVEFTGNAIHAEPPDRVAALRVENVEVQGGGVYVVGGLRMRDSVVENAPGDGVWVNDAFGELGGFATISSSIIRGSAVVGVRTRGRLSISDTEISDNADVGIASFKNLKIQRCDILNNGFAGANGGARVKVFDSTVAGNGIGLMTSQFGGMVVQRSNVSGNVSVGVDGRSERRAKVKDSTISSNGTYGVQAHHASVTGSVLQDNGIYGIESRTATATRTASIKDSTLTGNGIAAACAVDTICADIAASNAPKLKQVVCERSYVSLSDPPASWGVCSLD